MNPNIVVSHVPIDPLNHIFDPIEDPDDPPSNLPIVPPDLQRFDPNLERDVNNPNTMDLDSACFMILTVDLPKLIGNIARPANRRINVRDATVFKDWIHVISDPIVVKINGGDNIAARQLMKKHIISRLRKYHHFTLTGNENQFILSKNQVNVSVKFMARALYTSGARACRVSFFGLKWDLADVEPTIDRFISHYNTVMQAHAIRGMNMFDIGVIYPSNTVDLFSFSREQRHARVLHDTRVHEMCNVSNFGSLKFCLSCDPRIKNIKIYQELCHGVVSMISKDFLDDMPKTMMTMKTRFYQMASLYKILTQDMDDAERREFFLGTRIEVTIYDINKIVDACTICSRLDLL